MSEQLPLQVQFSTVREFLEGLGIDVTRTLSVTFGVDSVTVEQARHDPMGRAVAAGNNLATVTTVIGYVREDDA